MLQKLDFAGVIRLLDEVMILPVIIIGLLLLAYNWRTFSIVWFFFQSVDYTNSIRDLIVITVFFHIGS